MDTEIEKFLMRTILKILWGPTFPEGRSLSSDIMQIKYDIPLEYTMKKEFSIFGEFVQTRIQHPKRHPVETIKNN